MQTGNTIFLALGASDQNAKPYVRQPFCNLSPRVFAKATVSPGLLPWTPSLLRANNTHFRSHKPQDWARSLCSIGCFAVGAFFFSRLHRILSPRHPQRGSLTIGFSIQAACVCVAAALIQAGAVNQQQSDDGATDWREIAPIALLSFQAAGQIVASRVLGVNEIPTVVITSLLCDLMSDPNLATVPVFHGHRKRNNRVAGFVLTLVGSILGGWMLKGTAQVQPVLWLVFGIKITIAMAWAVWKSPESKAETV